MYFCDLGALSGEGGGEEGVGALEKRKTASLYSRKAISPTKAQVLDANRIL